MFDCRAGGGVGGVRLASVVQRPWFQWGMLKMLTICPGRVQGQMRNQLSHTVSMFDKDEGMLKKWRQAGISTLETGSLFSCSLKVHYKLQPLPGSTQHFTATWAGEERYSGIQWSWFHLHPSLSRLCLYCSCCSSNSATIQEVTVQFLSGCLDCQKQIPAHTLPPKALTNVCVINSSTVRRTGIHPA